MAQRAKFVSSLKPSKVDDAMKALSDVTAPDPEALVQQVKAAPLAQQSKPPGKRYEGMKKMLIPLDPNVHRKLKMMAVQNDMTLEKIVQQAIEKYLSDVNR